MSDLVQLRKIISSIGFVFLLSTGVAYSQGQLAPVELNNPGPVIPSLTPVDITPVNTSREQQLLSPGLTYYLFNKLPSPLWFNVVTETSQRYESNVFFSRTRYVSDYVYRILPNITLGYEGPKKISIYSNYFTIKDVFVGHHQLTFPTTQSLSMGFRRNFEITPKTNLQLDFQSRELWQTTGLHQADLIPAMTLTRFLTPHAIVYANLLLQMRGRYYYVAPTREIDPFYTIGALYSKNSWMFSAVATLVTNFRHPPFNDAIPNQSNNSIICDFEVNHPIPKTKYLVAFVRAEPIFNWNGNGVQGISGMDFRLFSGIRLALAKPTYTAAMDKFKKQLQNVNTEDIDPGSGIPEPPSPPDSNNKSNNNTQPGGSTSSGLDSPSYSQVSWNPSSAPLIPALDNEIEDRIIDEASRAPQLSLSEREHRNKSKKKAKKDKEKPQLLESTSEESGIIVIDEAFVMPESGTQIAQGYLKEAENISIHHSAAPIESEVLIDQASRAPI